MSAKKTASRTGARKRASKKASKPAKAPDSANAGRTSINGPKPGVVGKDGSVGKGVVYDNMTVVCVLNHSHTNTHYFCECMQSGGKITAYVPKEIIDKKRD